eukprot:sb/3470610/
MPSYSAPAQQFYNSAYHEVDQHLSIQSQMSNPNLSLQHYDPPLITWREVPQQQGDDVRFRESLPWKQHRRYYPVSARECNFGRKPKHRPNCHPPLEHRSYSHPPLRSDDGWATSVTTNSLLDYPALLPLLTTPSSNNTNGGMLPPPPISPGPPSRPITPQPSLSHSHTIGGGRRSSLPDHDHLSTEVIHVDLCEHPLGLIG